MNDMDPINNHGTSIYMIFPHPSMNPLSKMERLNIIMRSMQDNNYLYKNKK